MTRPIGIWLAIGFAVYKVFICAYPFYQGRYGLLGSMAGARWEPFAIQPNEAAVIALLSIALYLVLIVFLFLQRTIVVPFAVAIVVLAFIELTLFVVRIRYGNVIPDHMVPILLGFWIGATAPSCILLAYTLKLSKRGLLT